MSTPIISYHLKGVILAAGLGTRLRPLTDHYPKPLVEVAGRPLIEWGLISLMQAGITQIGVNTHYRAEQLHQHLNLKRCDQLAQELHVDSLNIQWSHEPELLGTGGGVRALWLTLFGADSLNLNQTTQLSTKQPLLLCLNGDALFDFSLQPLLDDHVKDGGCVSTLALREVPYGDPFGRVGVDACGRVVRIAEVKGPRAHEEVKVGAFTGAQVMSEKVAKQLVSEFSDTFRTAHRSLLTEDIEIRAHFVAPNSLWHDIGSPTHYLEAHQMLLERRESPIWKYVPPHQQQNNSILFEGAQVNDQLELGDYVWVGAHTHINTPTPTQLSHSVIWNHAQVNLAPPSQTKTSVKSHLAPVTVRTVSKHIFTPETVAHVPDVIQTPPSTIR